MRQVTIENPVINSPFREPSRHFKFSDEGITNEINDGRRKSAYFIPIASPKKKGKSTQMYFDTEWTQDRIEENTFVNEVRALVTIWRKGGYQGVTRTTQDLLRYWQRPDRDRQLFFCQIEAAETAIYITEAAGKYGGAWIEEKLRQANEDANPALSRIALKMATGSGKTVVMGMLVSWHVLNKIANQQDARFSDTFLIVTPGLTIRDRLRVLLPNDPENYYHKWDLVPANEMETLRKAKILITNFHTLRPREKGDASRLTKAILAKGGANPFTETPDQMVRRVCRDLGNKKGIIVINDEAHHCYRRRVADAAEEKLIGDDRREAEKREEEARVWISGLEAIKEKVGIRGIYDLSATPFFLKGSGYSEGTLFPWVVSDFSLIDAIEAGIVKVPRVPVADDQMKGDKPTYRDLWLRIKDGLPKKGRGTDAMSGEPILPIELQGALHSLYGNYEKYYRRWEADTESRANGMTPPVFIVVCNNTNVSKLVYDYVAGWEKDVKGGKIVVVPGQLPIFNNEEHGAWLARPNTILIDSEQLESGEAMSADFKKMVAVEIEEFKSEYRARFPGRDAEQLTDEDILREVMNTVGKPSKLGEQIKCVVSVSMLTEGWDANTVTHILGIRGFGTQLLCEQVVGRGLRRMSYVPNENGMFDPQYAEVYGVPFSFIPCSGSSADPKPGPMPTRVRALEDRIACEITFPRLAGYRYRLPADKLTARFTEDSKLALTTADVPTKTENAPIVGESSIHTLDDLKRRRPQEVEFLLAKLVLEKYFRSDPEQEETKDGKHRFIADVQAWLFPQVLAITRQWLKECVVCKDNTFPQMLLLLSYANTAADRIYHAIVRSSQGEKAIMPIMRAYDSVGTTRYVDFDTTKAVYPTAPAKCHISHVVADTETWEQKMAQTLEEMDEVECYVKNQNLGFTIPYTMGGEERNYYPDFIVRIKDGSPEPLNLVIEVTGERKKDKETKVSTAKTLWTPAVNNHGGYGRWAFLEIGDPWNSATLIRAFLKPGASVA